MPGRSAPARAGRTARAEPVSGSAGGRLPRPETEARRSRQSCRSLRAAVKALQSGQTDVGPDKFPALPPAFCSDCDDTNRTSRVVQVGQPRAKVRTPAVRPGCRRPRKAEPGRPTRPVAPPAAAVRAGACAPCLAFARNSAGTPGKTAGAAARPPQPSAGGHAPVAGHQLARLTTGPDRHVAGSPVNVLVRPSGRNRIPGQFATVGRKGQRSTHQSAGRRDGFDQPEFLNAAARGGPGTPAGTGSATSTPLSWALPPRLSAVTPRLRRCRIRGSPSTPASAPRRPGPA